MAEVGLFASIVALVSFTAGTVQTCTKLIGSLKNAPTDISQLGVELLDLAQVLELVGSTLQSVKEPATVDRDFSVFVEKSLSGLKKHVDEIASILTSVQPKCKSYPDSKGRLKWVYKKEDVNLAMNVLERHKQTLLTKLSVINLYSSCAPSFSLYSIAC